jgi:uncharacterized protein YukE
MADVVMEYELMHEMSDTFDAAAETLDQHLSGLTTIGGLIDGGALVGKGGQKLADLIQNGITKFAEDIKAKMEELASDIDGARAFLEEGDQEAASRFH